MRKAGKRIFIVGLICLIGPLFGFTFKGLSDSPVEISQIMGLGALIVGGIILACTKSENNEEYKCPNCGEIVTKGEEKCPNCKTKFDWDEDEEDNDDTEDDEEFKCPKCGETVTKKEKECPNCGVSFDWDDEENDNETEENDNKDNEDIVYTDEYYKDYSNNMETLNTNIKNAVFNYVTILYEESNNKEIPFIKYNEIHNYEDYHNSMKIFIFAIQSTIHNDSKDINIIMPLTKYFVKYYTKYIIKYGDKEDKMYLSRVIRFLDAVNKEPKEDEEVTLYSDEYYLEYAKSLPLINKEMKAQIFNLLKGLGEVTKLEKPIKDYSKINTREDYLNSVSCMHAVIQTAKDEKKYETAVIFTIYFVKYYTKLILKYGNKEEKMILASYVNILKTLKN